MKENTSEVVEEQVLQVQEPETAGDVPKRESAQKLIEEPIFVSVDVDSERIGIEENEEGNESKIETRIDDDPAKISLDFKSADTEENSIYPKSYYTFNAKERLLLIFAENFRRQFRCLNPNRSLVLAIANECGIQKFVSTTIRPAVFLYAELIDNWQGIAQFVADFIVYEPLDDPIQLVSPAY